MRFLSAVLAALLVLMPAVPAPAAWVCAHTGFNIGIGAGKSARCGVTELLRGEGTLTFNGTTTVTVAPAGFDDVVTPEAVPGADGVVWKASGLMALLGGELYFLNITAKASDSSITAQIGGAALAATGTTTSWSVWNTTCYRSAVSTYTGDATGNKDPRIWPSSTTLEGVPQVSLSVGSGDTGVGMAYTQSAASCGTPVLAMRPSGFSAASMQLSAGISTFSFAATNATAREATFQSFTWGNGLKEKQYQVLIGGQAAATYCTACIFVPQK